MRLFAKSLTAVTATGALLLTPIVASATEPVAAYTVDLLAAPGVEASGDAAHPEDWGGDGSVVSPGGESDTPRIDQVVESHDEKVKYSVAGYRQARSVAHSEDTEPTDTNSDDAIEPSRDGGYELLTAALKTEEFQVAGVIWTGAAPERIDVRSYVGGEWSEWYMLDFETAPKGAASESERVAGTEPYMSAGATGIQARATGTVLPDTFELQLMTGETTDGIVEELAAEVAERQPEEGSHNDAAPIADGLAEEIKDNVAQNPGQNPGQNPERDTAEQATGNNASVQSVSGEDAQVVTSPAAYKTNSKTSATVPAGISVPAAALRTVPTAVTRPAIYARAYWGGPSTSTWKPQYYKLKGAVIHHTAGTNYYTRAQSAGIVKGIWSYHAKSLGWGDVGYNFLIDKYGQVFEGRLGSLNAPAGKMVEGGHALGANTYTVGLSVLGNYYGASNPNPSAESITAIENVLAWQFSLAGLNPNGTWYNANAVAGFPKTIGTIVGHKDTSATGCPGKIYDRIPAIRTAVKNKIASGGKTSSGSEYPKRSGNGWPIYSNAWGAGDFLKNGYSDLLLRQWNGDLYVYNGVANDSFQSGKKIGHGWNIFKDLYTGIDFNGDGYIDIIGRNGKGELYLYPGRGNGLFSASKRIGVGWGSFSHIFLVEKGPGGHPAMFALYSNGTLRVYPTNGRGTWSAAKNVGTGYASIKGAVAVGNWGGDSYTDILVTDSSGRLFYRPGSASGAFGAAQQIGHGWSSFPQIERGDVNNSTAKLLAIGTDRLLLTYEFKRR